MTLPPSVITASAQGLSSFLLARHFSITVEQHDEDAFGNVLIQFERGPTAVRIVKDRGQWFVDVGGMQWRDWFAPAVWRAYLESSAEPVDPLSFEAQAAILEARLSQITELCADVSGGVLAGLRDCRSRGAAARRAQPPPE